MDQRKCGRIGWIGLAWGFLVAWAGAEGGDMDVVLETNHLRVEAASDAKRLCFVEKSTGKDLLDGNAWTSIGTAVKDGVAHPCTSVSLDQDALRLLFEGADLEAEIRVCVQEEALRFLKEELGLTDAQFDEYKQLRQEHRRQSESLHWEQRELRRIMMGELFEADTDTLRAFRLAQRIGDVQEELERLTLMHFMDLRELIGSKQQEKLRALIDEFFRQNQPSPPPGYPPDGDRPPPGRGHRPPPQDRSHMPPALGGKTIDPSL